MLNFTSGFDIAFSILLIIAFMLMASLKYSGKKENYYKYYQKGLAVKLFGGFTFCFIYAFYYGGGDTVNYYEGIYAMFKLFWDSPSDYFYVLFSENDYFSYMRFDIVNIRPPLYMFKDDRTFNVIRFTSLISFFSFGGFFSTTIILARIMYIWVWQLFEFVVERYQSESKLFAIAVLYFPSCVFWGSGIMKDTFTFSATCFVIVSINNIFLIKRKIISNTVLLILALYLILSIKSYILFALLPGSIIFLNFERIKAVRSSLVKFAVLPVMVLLSILFLQFVFTDMEDLFGRYSADRLLEEAAIQQQDLKRDVYGSNSFDIGDFDPTITGVLSKTHLAINAALFRPYIWEAGSPVMYISGFENILLLIISIFIFLFKGALARIKFVFGDGMLIFCLLFTVLLAFGVGLSTSNFGALVRYRIPFIPFYSIILIVISKKLKPVIKVNET